MEGTIRKRYLLSFIRLKTKEVSDKIGKKENVFESTDYFDKLEISTIGMQEDLADFMGIRSEQKTMESIVAVQNYSLFADVDRSKEKETDALFAPNEPGKFLSLIQVYITPEVIFKLSQKQTDYFGIFEKEIEGILNAYKTKFKSESELSINAGVFRMMSGGDFMIAVRSKIPEAAYLISTQIRRKLIHVQDNKDDRLALFKTLTILSYTADGKSEDKDLPKGMVVVRGRYSNKYWQNFPDKSNSSSWDRIKNMNGRYDLTACMTWGDLEKITSGDKDTKDGPKTYINGIKDLYEDERLSYFNKRYLMDSDTIWGKEYNSLCKEIKAHVEGIYLDSEHKKVYLMNEINAACEQKLEKINKLLDESKSQSITVSLNILKGLVFLCQTVNSLSDMRIYVRSLLRQIQVVLACAGKWLASSSGKDNMPLLEIYLRQAAVDLEAYGSVIRDDNLQTLHAPSYHVVTGSSVEKILISYSRFLNEMMRFCDEELRKRYSAGQAKGKKTYEAVMVPQLDKDSLEVEVLFPEWIHENNEKFLLVARGPSTEELVNVPKMITALFHEMAHQLRYESRSERNKILRHLFSEGVSNVVTEALFEQMGLNKLESDITNSMKVMFSEVICTQLQAIVLEEVPDECLESYKMTLQNQTDRFFQMLQVDESKLKALVQRYITDTSEYIDGEEPKIWEALNQISVKIQAFENLDDSKSEEENHEEEKKAELCKALEEYAIICGQTARGLWFGDGGKAKGENNETKIRRMRDSLEVQINESSFSVTKEKKEQKNRFLRNVFNMLCQKWSRELQLKEAGDQNITPDQKEWIRLGRKFGIDHVKNRESFENKLIESLTRLRYYPFAESLWNLELYREETSDIFMVAMCGLEIDEFISYSAQLYPHHNEQYAPGNLERAADVILLFWGKEYMKNPDTPEHSLWGSQMFGKIYEQLVQPNEKIDPSVLIQKLQDYAANEENGDKRYTALFTVQLNDVIRDRVNWMETRKYLYDDLMKGKSIYEDLRKSITVKTEGTVPSKDVWKKYVADLCDKNKTYFRITGYGKEETMEDCRKEIENFLINMHMIG